MDVGQSKSFSLKTTMEAYLNWTITRNNDCYLKASSAKVGIGDGEVEAVEIGIALCCWLSQER